MIDTEKIARSLKLGTCDSLKRKMVEWTQTGRTGVPSTLKKTDLCMVCVCTCGALGYVTLAEEKSQKTKTTR